MRITEKVILRKSNRSFIGILEQNQKAMLNANGVRTSSAELKSDYDSVDTGDFMWGDIRQHRLLYIKGLLFVGLGLVSAVLLLLFAPQWQVALLLAVCVWSFARAYYFAFYVIEHYVDSSFRFSGLTAFVQYAVRNRFGGRRSGPPDEEG